MTPIEAESKLKSMLSLADFDFHKPNLALAWSVFKAFTELPVDDVESGILWQIGCYSFTGQKMCHLGLVRQFSFDVDGEYDHMEQLQLEFTCEPTKELLQLKRNRWSFDYPSLEEYFADVESFPEFKSAINHALWKVTIQQELV